jgi:hypothetical protein
MRLTIDIPDPQQAVSQACPVPLAIKGVTWKESCLGKQGKESGVYIIHHGGAIVYVGKTGSPGMSFGLRLRREFQQTASSDRHIYPKLASLTVPPDIMVSFFCSKDIDRLVNAEGITLNGFEKIEIFETAAIHAYLPGFQRHLEKRLGTHWKKLNVPEHAREAMKLVLKQGPR